MSKLRLAVIGAGHLGKIHAKLAAQLDDATLTTIVEPQLEAGCVVAAEHHARCVADWEQAARDFDAAIVAAPTSLHDRLGMSLVQKGKHVLMEKPICENSQSAAKLVAAARAANRVLQVGHVERFNPAFSRAAAEVSSPFHIEAAREGRYTGRSVDVGVVLDLMIHDIDLALSLINSPLQRVSAIGASVVGPHEDMAQVWLEFANGATASLKASRVSDVPQRWMKVTGPFAQAHVDFGNRTAACCRPSLQLVAQRASGRTPDPEFSARVQEQHLRSVAIEVPADANPILDEQRDFIQAIHNNTRPRVTGEDGLRALSVAEEVVQQIQQRTLQSHGQPKWPRRAA